MSVPAFGYIFASHGPTLGADFGPNYHAGQYEIVESYADRHNLALDAVFVENADSVRTRWFARPAGRQIAGVLVPGCHVIVADATAVYTSAADLLSIIQGFQARGIVLHFARFQLPGHERASLSTAGEMGEVMVKALTAIHLLGRSGRGEAIAEGMRRKKEQRRRHCKDAGAYGHRWVRGRLVVDEDEQNVIRHILRWREEGFTYHAIAVHLLLNRVRTAKGGEWSEARVRRVCLAAYSPSAR
jgi:DNA invertase Pin-like site-specific DNA recombinase